VVGSAVVVRQGSVWCGNEEVVVCVAGNRQKFTEGRNANSGCNRSTGTQRHRKIFSARAAAADALQPLRLMYTSRHGSENGEGSHQGVFQNPEKVWYMKAVVAGGITEGMRQRERKGNCSQRRQV